MATRKDLPMATGEQKKGKKKSDARRPPTFDHLKKKKPLERRVSVYLDDEGVERHRELTNEISLLEIRLRTARDDDKKDLAAQLDKARIEKAELEDELREHRVELVFRAIGRARYEALVDEHPPQDEDHETVKEQYGDKARAQYHGETFGPALIAAACVEPQLSLEQVMILFEGEFDSDGNEITPAWNAAELQELFEAALAVNQQRRTVNLGK